MLRLLLMYSFSSANAALARPIRLKIGDVKQRLARFGVSTAGIMEAETLREMLAQQCPAEASGAGHAVPLERARAADAAMGDGVNVFDKTYYSIRLELSGAEASRAAGVQWVIDSAASNSLITPAAAQLLGARGTGVTASADTSTTTGVGGFKQVDLGTASLAGGLMCGPLQPVVMELPVAGECGLLGLDFLTRHDIDLRLRPALPCAVFHDTGSAVRGELDSIDGLSELGCTRLPSGLLSTRVQLVPEGGAGGEVQAVVDLGSTVTLCTWAAAEAAGLQKDDPRVRQTDDVIAGATGEPVRVSEVVMTLQIGGAKRTDVLVNIADLPIFSAIGLPPAAAVLGLDTLAPNAETNADGSRIVLAAKDTRVWIEA